MTVFLDQQLHVIYEKERKNTHKYGPIPMNIKLHYQKLNVIGCLIVQLDFIYSTCLTNLRLFLTLGKQITRAHPCGIATFTKID